MGVTTQFSIDTSSTSTLSWHRPKRLTWPLKEPWKRCNVSSWSLSRASTSLKEAARNCRRASATIVTLLSHLLQLRNKRRKCKMKYRIIVAELILRQIQRVWKVSIRAKWSRICRLALRSIVYRRKTSSRALWRACMPSRKSMTRRTWSMEIPEVVAHFRCSVIKWIH